MKLDQGTTVRFYCLCNVLVEEDGVRVVEGPRRRTPGCPAGTKCHVGPGVMTMVTEVHGRLDDLDYGHWGITSDDGTSIPLSDTVPAGAWTPRGSKGRKAYWGRRGRFKITVEFEPEDE